VKQLLQNLNDGSTLIVDVPAPRAGRGQLLIRTTCSLVSAGTERMLVDFGKAGLIEKARQQPDKVRQVLDKVRTDGLAPTLEAVRAKLDQPIPLGYCNVGRVVEVGAGVTGFAVGDRVASNGRHAEIVSVPVNLAAKVPDDVSDEAASFAVLGAIALQGIRLIAPTLGETVVVTGLGLIGLMAVQLLAASGCRVLGIDPDPAKCAMARRLGAEAVDLSTGADPVAAAERFSRGRGVDAVLITAATRSSEPVHQAALMCRKRGRIVLTGVTGLELSRADFYEKELTFQVSCSYGPGRYDPAYEDGGHDYPFGFVRWTEQRNIEAVLDMLAARRLDVAALVTHRYALAEAEAAYRVVSGAEPSLGIVLQYHEPAAVVSAALTERTLPLPMAGARKPPSAGAPVVSFIGAGNYASRVLMPAFKAAGVHLKHVASGSGLGAAIAGPKHGFGITTTDIDAVLTDPEVDAVVIATRHDTHARFAIAALDAGKHVLVEKPLCLTLQELAAIEAAYGRQAAAGRPRVLMVGFNRRFAPLTLELRRLLAARTEPKAFVMTVNAGAVPPGHWTQDEAEGGGRIIGEACHFIDLLRHLAGATIVSHAATRLAAANGDTATLQLAFADGSIGTVHYLANGHRSFPKERLEVFCGAGVLVLDNFRILRGHGWPGFGTKRLWRQDKGQRACVDAFLSCLRTPTEGATDLDASIEASRVSIALAKSG
jgi:predicted dehydrogenase/threonine dehydrogenase-like Zn-dependent dehydrogenase